MHAMLRRFAPAVILLISGIAIAAAGVRGVIGDIAATAPVRWPFSTSAYRPEAAWWLRACLSVPQCREEIAVRFDASLAEHARPLGYGLLVILVSLAWLGMLGPPLRVPARPASAARFASRAEMRRLARRSPGAWFPLGYARRWPHLFRSPPLAAFVSPLLTAWAQPVRLPGEDVARHVLVTGLTGAHKTTSVTLPVLLEAARAGVTVIAFDLKHGERDTLAAAVPEWWRHGRRVLVFAPLDGASLRWNPLSGCRSLGSAYEFAAHLFPDDAGDGTDVAYWAGAERHVCATLVWAVVSDGLGRSAGRLRALAEAGPDAVLAYASRHPRAPEITRRLGAYRAMLPKDQAGILQGIAARLEAWADDRVSRATSGPDEGSSWDAVDLDRIRREPTLLLVGIPQSALPRLRGLSQLFMRDLSTRMLRSRGPEDAVPVVFLLEELPAWGRVPQLADQLATFRSRGVAIVATVQSDAQGQTVYGSAEWAAVAANFVTKIYFPSLADLDAERLSRALGTAAAHQVSHSRAWGRTGRQDSEHRRMIDVPLRRPEALQGIDTVDDEVIVRCPGFPPVLLWCPPYYVRPDCRDRVPDVAPSTFEIALRHRLEQDHPGSGGAGHDGLSASHLAPVAASAPDTGDVTPRAKSVAAGSDANGPIVGAQRASAAPCVGARAAAHAARVEAAQTVPAPPSPRSETAPPMSDDAALSDLVKAVIKAFDRPGSTPGVSLGGGPPRIVCRGDRPVEMRLDPDQAFRLLGGGEAADLIVRRWAARRWIRRVRPTFVLEKRALEALDQDLQRALASIGATGTTPA